MPKGMPGGMLLRKRPVVAIDGPAGAGKSTVSRKLAERLGYLRVDTGALYRCIALAAHEAGVSWDDGPACGALANALVEAGSVQLENQPGKPPTVRLAGRDVSDAIRAPEMGQGASKVSAHPEVRAALLELQRQLGKGGGVVLEGRDIGSVVFPDAEVKFFLTASVAVRAKRRYDELVEKGNDVALADVEAEVEERDNRDRNRPVAPLVEPKGAILVDSSNLTIRQVVTEMADFVGEVVLRMPRT